MADDEPKPAPMRPRTVRLPDETWAWLDVHARRQDREVAWVIRKAVNEYRERQGSSSS